jgi:outer membrane protease
MQKTYLDLLAEQDSEARTEYVNPKDLLVEHNVFDQDIEAEDHHEDELEDQEAFQKFGGSHQEASYGGPQKPSTTTHKTAVDYDKAVQVHVISVDSRFRTNRLDANFDFLYKTSILFSSIPPFS